MQISIGSYELSVTKASRPRPTSVITGTVDTGFSRLLYNTSDSPRTNIALIRETVSACMHARSEAVGRGRFHSYKQRTSPATGSQLPASHPLEALLRAPNPLLDFSDLLELASQWLDATGNALFLKVRNARGEVVELWPAAALSFTIEKGDDEMPMFYRFMPSDTRVPASDLVHIRRADIRTAPFYGHAILSDLLATAKADAAIRAYQERFFENDAIPRAVMKFPQGTRLTQEQLTALRKGWEEKFTSIANTGRLAILSDGAELEVLGASVKELDFARSRNDLRDAIRESFKVPKIVLGDVDDVNLSNAETSYHVFMRDVVDYSLGKIARALTRSLASEWGPDITIEHDSVIPENEERILGRLRELKTALTVNEQRAFLGMPPLTSAEYDAIATSPRS